MVKKVWMLLIFLFLSFAMVSLSILLGAKIDSYEEFRKAKFGYPVPFLDQDLYASGAYKETEVVRKDRGSIPWGKST